MEDKLFRIGWMTKTLGLSRRILINYETVGLLTPAYKDEQTGYRYYSADNIVHIRLIRILQELGLSLEDIKDYFNDYSHIAEEIEKLVVLRNMLDQYIAQLRLRQTKNNEFEIKKVTLPEFCAYCVEFSGLDLARKTVRLRETYIEAFSKYTMDFDNKMCKMCLFKKKTAEPSLCRCALEAMEKIYACCISLREYAYTIAARMKIFPKYTAACLITPKKTTLRRTVFSATYIWRARRLTVKIKTPILHKLSCLSILI